MLKSLYRQKHFLSLKPQFDGGKNYPNPLKDKPIFTEEGCISSDSDSDS